MVAMMPLHATTARLERSTMIPTSLKKSVRPRDARGRFIRHHERLPVALADTRGALFVVSEMADFIKAGGLGDVAYREGYLRRRHCRAHCAIATTCAC